MTKILNIETASKNCSVAVAFKGKEISVVEQTGLKYSHGEKIHEFIEKAISEANIKKSMLDAVAISIGPGSYTGLRIGLSTAKGLCYGLGIPLITTKTLKTLIIPHLKKIKTNLICPMLNSRAEEVYATLYNTSLEELIKTQTTTVQSFFKKLKENKITFLGPGVERVKKKTRNKNAFFLSKKEPSAKGMCKVSYEKFIKKKIEDYAYTEPFYVTGFYNNKKLSK